MRTDEMMSMQFDPSNLFPAIASWITAPGRKDHFSGVYVE